jgi:hypothetical protein
VEEGLDFQAASARLVERKRDEQKKRTVRRAKRALFALVAMLGAATCAWRRMVGALRAHAATNGSACATPAALWRRADLAVVVFADTRIPTLVYPQYNATSGDFVRSYELSPQCPHKTTRMRHKHIKAWSPMSGKTALTGTDASCLQHYADLWKTGHC